ncbi:MAG TPA: cytochrome c family protein [Rhizobiaceae bacterium]|nr:cytochrome c family protein [Rhizobiaceae bacterium]
MRTIFFAAILSFVSLQTSYAQDAAAGKSVFNRCRPCHEAEKEMNKVGPHLVGIVGRPAGSLETFNYSKAMKEAGSAGLVWDEPNLAEYLRAPKAKVPGGSMAFAGLKDDKMIADLIVYLKADPKP